MIYRFCYGVLGYVDIYAYIVIFLYMYVVVVISSRETVFFFGGED